MLEESDVYSFLLPLVSYPDDPLGYSGRLELSADEALKLPVRADGSRRFICQIEDLKPWHAALISDGIGSYFILVNKERNAAIQRAGFDLRKLKVQLMADQSEYGMEMPEELGELLLMDAEANTYFHALSPGKQRALIYLVAKPKGEATRLKKAVGIVSYLLEVRGKLDFRELGDWLKETRI